MLFEKCNILTLYEIHYFKVALFMFKCHHKKVPEVFTDYFVSNYQIHNYSTRSRNKLHIPFWKSDVMKHSIRVKGVYIWNYVYNHITVEKTFASFKTNLRKLLLCNKDIINVLP